MAKFITQNPNIYNIHYNDENELYEATYNSDKYVVKYGKEILNKKSENKNILSLLNDLEKISNKQLSLNEIMEKEQELEKENRERVIENGKKGILKKSSEKRIFIDYLKDKDKKNKHGALKNTFKDLKRINYLDEEKVGSHSVYQIALSFVTAGIGLLIQHGVFGGSELAAKINGGFFLLMWADAIITFVSNFVLEEYLHKDSFRGIIIGLLSIIMSPIIYGKNLVKRLKEKIELNKKINPIKKSIYINEDKERKEDAKVSEKDLMEILGMPNEKENNNDEIDDDFTLQEFESLKNDILKIEDKTKRNTYKEQLTYIISSYMNAIQSLDKKDLVIVKQRLFDHTTNIRVNVNEILDEERRINNFNRECNSVIEELNSPKALYKRL